MSQLKSSIGGGRTVALEYCLVAFPIHHPGGLKMQAVTTRKGRLPAFGLSAALLEELWRVLGQAGEFTWQASVGTGQDPLGRQEGRPQEDIVDRDALEALLAVLPRIDSLRISVEFAGQGAVLMTFRNYNPPGGSLVVSGTDPARVGALYENLTAVFAAAKEDVAAKLYSRVGFSIIQSGVPLVASFIIVVLAAALLIPAWVRQSEWIWWISAITMLATLWIAAKISDRLIRYCLQKYPYIRWLS